MTRLAMTVVFTVAALPATAMAQAPGECTSCVAPAPVAATAVAVPDDMAHRLGIGLHMASLSLDDHSGADPTQYGGGGLIVSYRVSRRWELALSMDGYQSDGKADLHSGLIEARFHMMPHQRWDWYLLAGLGGLHEDTAGDGTDRGQMQLGVGVQRRFEHLSLSAELRAVGVGPIENAAEMPPIERTEPAPMMGDGKLGGGQFTLGAMYYF
jgi:hypothetical protein